MTSPLQPVAIATALMAFSACVGARIQRPAYTSTPARLELKIAPEVGPPSVAHYEIMLTNIYDRPLWVNRRLGMTMGPPGYGELEIEIRGDFGEINFNCAVDAVRAEAKDYVALKPGESIGGTSSLRCFSDLKPGELYTARAHYHDRNPDAPLSPPSAVYLSTEIISEPVQFKVVACPADLAAKGWCDIK